MTSDNPTQKQAHRPRLAVAVVLLVLVGGLLAGVVVGPASAADYYNNSSGVVQPDAPENVTLDSLVGITVDLAPDLIGTGEQDPSATGFQGVLLTGVTFAFVAVGAMIGTGIGTVGGTVLGLTVSYGLVDVGYAPQWIKVLLLFGVGVVVFIAIRKALEGQ